MLVCFLFLFLANICKHVVNFTKSRCLLKSTAVFFFFLIPSIHSYERTKHTMLTAILLLLFLLFSPSTTTWRSFSFKLYFLSLKLKRQISIRAAAGESPRRRRQSEDVPRLWPRVNTPAAPQTSKSLIRPTMRQIGFAVSSSEHLDLSGKNFLLVISSTSTCEPSSSTTARLLLYCVVCVCVVHKHTSRNDLQQQQNAIYTDKTQRMK